MSKFQWKIEFTAVVAVLVLALEQGGSICLIFGFPVLMLGLNFIFKVGLMGAS